MIDDVVIEERLRRTFDAVARRAAIENAEPAPFVEVLPQPKHRQRPRPLLPAIAAFAAICVGSVVALAAWLGHDTTRPRVVVSSPTPSTSTAATDNQWCVAISRDAAIGFRGVAYGTVIIADPNARAKLVSLAELLQGANNPFIPTDPQTHLTDHHKFWVVELRPTSRTQDPHTWGLVALDASTGAVVTVTEGPSTGPAGVISEPAAEPPYWNNLPDHGAECPPHTPAISPTTAP